MSEKNDFKQAVRRSYTLRQAIELGAFEDEAMDEMDDDDFINVEERLLGTGDEIY